jgi:hypothetical protein
VQKNALFKAQQAVITTTQFFNCGRWAKIKKDELFELEFSRRFPGMEF